MPCKSPMQCSCVDAGSSENAANLKRFPRPAQSGGGCPVVGVNASQSDAEAGRAEGDQAFYSQAAVFVQQWSYALVPRAAGCPVISPAFNPRNLMSSPNNQPAPDQSKSLDTQRAASTIPIGGHPFPGASECMIFSRTMLFMSFTPCWAGACSDLPQGHPGVCQRAWTELLWPGVKLSALTSSEIAHPGTCSC